MKQTKLEKKTLLILHVESENEFVMRDNLRFFIYVTDNLP